MLRHKLLIGLLSSASLFPVFHGGIARAQQEIGFSEKFALSENREAVLAELIPDTDLYYYYHCLHCQTVGKVTEARGFLDAWIGKVGINDQTQKMQTRQLLLEYRNNPQSTLNHLKSTFGINTDHPAPRKNEAAELETKLNPSVLNWESLLQSHAENLVNIETVALGHATPFLKEQTNLRTWLERIDRADTPKLVDWIERELKMPDSRGFGWASIHNQLTTNQLIELQKRIPNLLESNAYVQARLRRIRPNEDRSFDDDVVRKEQLEALESFANTLPESQNSLKACVLYHRLQLDERTGSFDRNRFIRFLQLPSARPYTNRDYLVSQQGRAQVNLGANYKGETTLEPIGDDTALVLRYLEHFLQSDPNVDAFATFLDRDFLKRVFATTKILHGIGDSKTYYSQLSADQQRELQSRIEVQFSVSNPTFYRPDDAVRLALDLKNTPEVLVKIYRLNAKNILLQQKRPIATDIDLDGLVANLEKRLSFAQPSDRRHREVLELPELAGGGVWVVDVLSGGLRSRTLIQKGHLHAAQWISNAGSVFRVFDADGNHAPNAKAIYGNREFTAEKDGNIVVPFGQTTQSDTLLLVDGAVASVQPFVLYSESYSLVGGFLVDPQSMLSGGIATMIARPSLLCQGELVSLSDLEKPELTITTTDLDGILSVQSFVDVKLGDNVDFSKTFAVPQRLAKMDFTLRGKVLLQSNETFQDVSMSHSVALNDAARTAQIREFYLTQTNQGYLLEVRGRNGEPASRIPVQFEFKLLGIKPTTSVRLATDENGIVDLGKLSNVERFFATSDGIPQRSFAISGAPSQWPASYHCAVGDSIELAISSTAGTEPIAITTKASTNSAGRYSLCELRGGVVFATKSEEVVTERGLLKIRGLDAGTYRLTDHAYGLSMQIHVLKTNERDHFLVGQNQILKSNRVQPIHIQEIQVGEDKIDIHVGNHNRFTRVHVIGDAFRPLGNLGGALPAPQLSLASAQRMRMPSFYINSMKLDEEYQYVLQRQFAKKYLGTLLSHPSVLLNPWELSVTVNTSRFAAPGDPMAAKSAPAPASAEADLLARAGDRDHSSGLPDYEFLQRGAWMLVNGQCNEQGILSIDRKSLEGLTSVTVLVVHPSGSTYHQFGLPASSERKYVDRRLAKAFAPTEPLNEVQVVNVLHGVNPVDLGDATSTRVKLYNDISDVFQLYRSLMPNQADLDKFQCLTQWASTSDEQKQVHYANLACHELNLFLMMHDRPFFDRVIKPYLANKMQKQFMDDYVLGNDLNKYVSPWKLAKLNAVERILLAKTVKSQMGSTKRSMGDFVDSIVVPSGTDATRFATALAFNGRWDVDDLSLVRLQTLDRTAGGIGAASENFMLRESSPQKPSENGRGSLGSADAFFADVDGEDKKAWKAENGEGKPGSNGPENRLVEEVQELYLGQRMTTRGRGLGRKLYSAVESTRKWAESNYYHLPLASQSAALVEANKFWRDYLNHADDTPFLSSHVDMAARNVHEALLALAVLGLPLKSETENVSIEKGRVIVTNTNAAIAFVQGLQPVEASTVPATILASRSLFVAADPVESAKALDGKSLVQGTVYRQRLVLTNPSAAAVRVSVLQQIPQGAIALENAKVVAGQKLDIAPFATNEIITKYYFPAAGEFNYYGAQITIDGKLAIATPAGKLNVLAAPDSIDESSWSYVATWGSDAQVLDYLTKSNLFKTDLDAIAWRMSNRAFYESCLQSLTNSGVYNATLWAYSIKHNDPIRIREYLENLAPLIAQVGMVFDSELIRVEPIERLAFEHLDFRPIIVARAHQLGTKRVILNDGLAIQYESLMRQLSHQKSLDSEQRLALVYYLILQNRIEEAIAHFEKITLTDLESQLQYDYFATYLDMIQGKFEEANTRSEKYATYPVPRWQDWFAQVRAQISERKAAQAGETTEVAQADQWKSDSANRLLSGGREQQNQAQAAVLPVLELIQDADKIVLRSRNLETIEINYYLMDVELLFSRNPFAQQDGGRLNSIEPNVSESRILTKAEQNKDQALVIPETLKNKNLVIEATAGGMTRTLVLYSNSLLVDTSPSMGRVRVLTKQGLQPLEGAYVKVYARNQSGEAKFYKDGYTDLRGQFDYVGLSTNDLDSTQRFSILVQHPVHGTIVRESEPPKR